MKTFSLEVEVLEAKSGDFVPEGETKSINYKNAIVKVVETGKLLKFKSKVDLKEYEGKTVTLGIELYSGQAYAAGVRVVTVE